MNILPASAASALTTLTTQPDNLINQSIYTATSQGKSTCTLTVPSKEDQVRVTYALTQQGYQVHGTDQLTITW